MTLLRAQYAVHAGRTVKLDLPQDSTYAIRQASGPVESRTIPSSPHGPFATADTDGNMVIAVPTRAAPGHYTVSLKLTVDHRTRAASVIISVLPADQPPPGSGTPVILLNGWQAPSLTQLTSCPTSPPDGSAPFGSLPGRLPVWSTFFDNCVECPNCPIEMLAADLGQRIASLTFSDGTPVDQVDVVAHSMGGLIVRSYLSGKSQTSGVFAPPDNPKIRKAIFIGTPHFGSFLGQDFSGQSSSLKSGSLFLWDLGSWNQGSDDLREVDALAIAGNAALDNQSDGVVALTSASLAFAGLPDERTRIINACHVDGALAYVLTCSTNSGIASSADSQQIVLSFLAGSKDWSSVGSTPSQDAFLAHNAGRLVRVLTAANAIQDGVSNMSLSGQAMNRNSNTTALFFNDSIPAGPGTLQYSLPARTVQQNVVIAPGGYAELLAKDPPAMFAVVPSAGAIHTRNIAPGSLISIFGVGLAGSTATSSFPWPAQLADVTLTVGGQPLQLLYVDPNQINAYFPTGLSGLVTLQLTNSIGQHSINVMTTAAAPAIFSADSSGTGMAAAIHASTGQPVTADNPAMAGEYIEIYGTGFGATNSSGGYDVSVLTPALTVGGESAAVTFSGIPQGAVGLYQVNFIVPDGLPPGAPADIVLSMGGYASNVVSLPIH